MLNHVRLVVKPIANAEGGYLLCKLRREVGIDGRLDVYSVCTDARLSRMPELTSNGT